MSKFNKTRFIIYRRQTICECVHSVTLVYNFELGLMTFILDLDLDILEI